MSASEHLHPELFHGTTNPNWRDNPDWIHAGSTRQAQQRLDTISPMHRDISPFSVPPSIHKIELHPESTVYPKVIPAREDPEDGFWADLGHRLDENSIDLSHPAYSHPSGKPYDVYPYENVDEGFKGDNTSYVINPKAIKNTKKVSE
jgi:hypothetical protein